MIARRRVLVIEDRKAHSVLIKMALRRLDEWVEARWVRDPVEAREALESEPGTDLILLSTEEGDVKIRHSLRTMVSDWNEAPMVAVICDEVSPLLREGLLNYPVTLLAHPLKTWDLGALLQAAALARLPGLPAHEMQH